ncbi:ABC transporter related protein [Methanohalobium evestigatum Z-7303]|uniref:ABC transporter related protein n=1 Tax=Methanohalobium evestigatum (strain ATCC BAA-1072 / DSM 3721 / NBRC 107634 / OCM 161 / Z-7303) TaxID=644295 RepID=D7E7I8_METEZ|nr:daunorubicin resistance protein DrrA family ABC transporter ATP-binding protein [Methanohalobium evestigatum]ADI74061.1 ABC transporter related protein [Methanohalobium evestigatum Z-7303]
MGAIEVENLKKKYHKFTAVDGISFSVEEGEIFAFLGPNGAGKTTSLKILTTILHPTSGNIRVNGYDVLHKKNDVRKSIGVIFQDNSLDDKLTAYENMEYHAVLYKVPKEEIRERVDKLLGNVELLDRKNDLIKTFSGGMKRRIEIARGLIHTPKVLFLDEPTLGLDAHTRAFLWEYIRDLKENSNLTVFLTTHNLDEAEKIADRIAIIDKGQIQTIGTFEQIKKMTGTNTLEQAFLKLTGHEIRN